MEATIMITFGIAMYICGIYVGRKWRTFTNE